jgi:exopolyphosphatase / guanosine-5'-triphosphate,3'-diphosphate pyrophosphatase
MNIRASIDIGSNSVLLLVASFSQGELKELSRRAEVTQLGRELDRTKTFHPESMSDTMEALRSYVEECKKFAVPPEAIIATATEAARVATNARDFFLEVEQELGLKVHIINSEAEALFSTKGILFNSKFKSDQITIMDIGGASTELIRVHTKTNQMETISMPVGSVRATQWLAEGLFVQNLQKIFLDFRNSIDKFQTKELYCVAGTITSLGNMHLKRKDFVEDDVHGLVMKAEDVDALFKKLADWTPEKFLEEFPFLQKRSRSIRGGLHLVYHLTHRLLVKDLFISTYGLRYGTLLEGKIKHEHHHFR